MKAVGRQKHTKIYSLEQQENNSQYSTFILLIVVKKKLFAANLLETSPTYERERERVYR